MANIRFLQNKYEQPVNWIYAYLLLVCCNYIASFSKSQTKFFLFHNNFKIMHLQAPLSVLIACRFDPALIFSSQQICLLTNLSKSYFFYHLHSLFYMCGSLHDTLIRLSALKLFSLCSYSLVLSYSLHF